MRTNRSFPALSAAVLGAAEAIGQLAASRAVDDVMRSTRFGLEPRPSPDRRTHFRFSGSLNRSHPTEDERRAERKRQKKARATTRKNRK